jgi:predicted component of type VI protein secretion system
MSAVFSRSGCIKQERSACKYLEGVLFCAAEFPVSLPRIARRRLSRLAEEQSDAGQNVAEKSLSAGGKQALPGANSADMYGLISAMRRRITTAGDLTPTEVMAKKVWDTP